MRYLFIPGADLRQPCVTIGGPDYHHLVHVLRVRPGEILTLLDNAGSAAAGEVDEIRKRDLTVRVLAQVSPPAAAAVHVTVAQALGKGDRFEQALQHATEVGASAFIPLLTERTVVRVDGRDHAAKLARWAQVVKGAAEQSGRDHIPEVEPIRTLPDLCGNLNPYDSVLLLHPEGDRINQGFSGPSRERVLLLIGPEGGFSPPEVDLARTAGAVVTRVSDYTLRTETAAVVALAQILHEASR